MKKLKVTFSLINILCNFWFSKELRKFDYPLNKDKQKSTVK